MFIVYKYTEEFYDEDRTYDIIDTDDLAVERFTYNEVKYIISRGIPIYGVDMITSIPKRSGKKVTPICDFGISEVSTYKLFLTSEDSNNFHFIVWMNKYGALKDILVVPKNSFRILVEKIKSDIELNAFHLFQFDYKFFSILDTLESDTNFYCAKEKLLTGNEYSKYRFTKKKFLYSLFVSVVFSNLSYNYSDYFYIYPRDNSIIDYLISLKCDFIKPFHEITGQLKCVRYDYNAKTSKIIRRLSL